MSVTLTIRSESASETHEIIAFSMVEPSTMSARFVTKDGRHLFTYSCVMSYVGDLNALPSVADMETEGSTGCAVLALDRGNQ